jgi:hypothetical protein
MFVVVFYEYYLAFLFDRSVLGAQKQFGVEGGSDWVAFVSALFDAPELVVVAGGLWELDDGGSLLDFLRFQGGH